MHWYKRDPDAAIVGMSELSLEECGAYNRLLDFLYSRDGDIPDDDALIARMLNCQPRKWRRLKQTLTTKGKVWVKDGKITAKRVENTILQAKEFSNKQSEIARKRWNCAEKNNEINNALMPRGNASTTTTTTTKKDILRSSSGAHDGNGSLKTESVDAPTKGTLAKDFLEFWAEFPKKKAKQTAQKAYAKARRTVSHEVIMGGLSRAKPGWSEHQFIPYPATWLNGGSWDDEATPQAGNNWKRAIL